MIRDLRNRVGVITGAASGIGRATAVAAAAQGMKVVLADINDDRLSGTVQVIESAGGVAIGQHCDVSKDEDISLLHQAALQAFGPVDLVMSNVGVLVLGEPTAIPMDAWRRALDVDLLSVVRAVREFLPTMLKRRSGHLVHTASTAGLWGYGCERLPYVAAKAGIVAISESLAVYCRPKGVGVTCVCPGPVATNIVEQVSVYGEVGPLAGPTLAILEPAEVATQIIQAVKDERFFLPTHDEVFEILRRKAEDPEAFVAELIEQRTP